jgi:hypothetical protein
VADSILEKANDPESRVVRVPERGEYRGLAIGLYGDAALQLCRRDIARPDVLAIGYLFRLAAHA